MGVLSYVFQNSPYSRVAGFDKAITAADVVHNLLADELRNDKGFKQLQRHNLGQAALVQLQLRSDHNHRATRVVHALAEKVLAEATLLTLKHIGDALKHALLASGSRYCFAVASIIVDKGVNCFLQHSFFVALDNLGRV